MLATTVPSIAVGVLGALLLVGAAGLFLLMAMGRLTLDLGWGRSVHRLGPITMQIAAPRDLVFEMINAPYAGRAPGGSGIEVIARDDHLVVAAHHTKIHFYTARTIEVIELQPSSRVSFRHIGGPVPHAEEQFALTETEDGTKIEYSGELGIDFFILGRVAGRRWVRPQWEGTVREHLEDLKGRAEQRASRQAARIARHKQG